MVTRSGSLLDDFAQSIVPSLRLSCRSFHPRTRERSRCWPGQPLSLMDALELLLFYLVSRRQRAVAWVDTPSDLRASWARDHLWCHLGSPRDLRDPVVGTVRARITC